MKLLDQSTHVALFSFALTQIQYDAPRSHNPRTEMQCGVCRSGGTNRDVSCEVIQEEDADHWARW
jgi:hypothetical protein